MNAKKASSKSKSATNLTILKSTPTPETSTAPCTDENDQILLETIRTIVKDELSAHEAAIIINYKLQNY